MNKINKAAWDALTPAEQAKYNKTGEDEYTLIEAAPDDKDKPAPGGNADPLKDPQVIAAIDAAKAAGKTEAETEAAARKAEEQGEFETLYKTEKQKAEDLAEEVTALEGEVEELREIVDKEIEAKKNALPDGIKKLMPKYDSRAEMLNWLIDAQAEAEELGGDKGNLPDPKPKGQKLKDGEINEETVSHVKGTGGYQM